jgi:DNA-binding NarL/FixJ family response regulator
MVMDIRLGGDDGLDTARRIRDIVPEVVIVIVSAASEAEWVSRAAKAGASAFAPKTAPLEEMLSVLRQATLGSMMVSLSTFRDAPKNERRLPLEVAPLSDREQAVLQLVGQALRADEIAPMLNITVNTCRSHIKSILAKLGVKSQLEAVVKAHRLGLIRINAAEMSELAV